MTEIKNISCPNCGHAFDVEEVLASKLDSKYRELMDREKSKLLKQYQEKEDKLQQEQALFEEKKKRENELFKQRLEKAVLDKEREVREKIKEDFESQIKVQAKDLEEKTKQVKALKDKEIELIRMQRKMEELEKDYELKYEQKMNHQLRQQEEAIAKRVREQMDMRIREKDKQLEDQKRLIEEMKRKSEQGSMQMQGEVMELAIEEMLTRAFPQDIIEEVAKGVRGADSIVTVRNNLMQSCGRIIFESKRTKNFVADWIDKLKKDQREIGADLAVLVTQTMPKDLDRYGEYNGVWICSFEEMTGLVYVLRQILIRSAAVKAAQENKGDKIEILYNYLTSVEFKNQVLALVEGFSKLREDLEKEKRAMKNIWKKREKQIEMITDSTINMYGSIRGIAGNAIPAIDALELDSEWDHNELPNPS